MTLTDLLAASFWPVVLGLIGWTWRLHARGGEFIVPLVGASLTVGASIVYLVIFGVASLVVLFDVFLGAILFGVLCLNGLYRAWDRITISGRALVGLFGLFLVMFGAYHIIGDYVRPRLIVEGPIENLFIHATSKGYDEYTVRINGQLYQATTRLYATLKRGEHVRAEIGRASEFIYRIDRKTP